MALEKFPREGYLTNVLGTKNLIDACSKYGVERFINVSTDKAAIPTSVLGATKRVGELLTFEQSFESNEIWSSVRFGNVFASRGSVIETFIHQIQNDLPITLTDMDVTRFFMSHDEAANLILASGSLEESSIFIQEMGDRVFIRDVILNLANALEKKPKIEIIGLQKGEKMHEDLYDGPVSSTKFSSIMKVKLKDNPEISSVVGRMGHPENSAEAVNYLAKLLQSTKTL